MTFQNHYAILGVSRTASHAEIKTAYNKLVLRCHPDKGGSEAEFIPVQAAWEVLRDETARAAFDRNHPTANGVPGKPSQSRSTFAQGRPFSKSQPFGGKSETKPDPRFSANAQPRPGSTNPNAWTSFRDSAAGNAYNSYHGFSRDSPPEQSQPQGPSRDHPRPKQNEPQEPKDTPMSDAPQAEETSRGSPRQSRPKARDTDANAKTQNPSPPPHDDSWSPPPDKHEVDVEEVKQSADRARRNAERFQEHARGFRSATSKRQHTELFRSIELKLRHVQCYLENCELKLRVHVYAAKGYNADVRAKKTPAAIPSYYPTLVRDILDMSDMDISDLKAAMARVIKDSNETSRIKKTMEVNGKKQTDDEETVRNLQSSTEALDRLLGRVLSDKMSYGLPSHY
ncbi:hypothetical protein H2200_004597 [Cladophialophora chaetospira]|uniref:J domain-containing protein n=1 Tax=Cladophialophora chaetospira TaxID=386627 RepID=A0AA38XDE3_9EURO|nr:hypothetical protein H2200_004597 [Cladophialophora chaetospira]